jgi:hypothetical protein
MSTLHEDVNRIYCCRWYKFGIKEILCKNQSFYIVVGDEYPNKKKHRTHCCLSIKTTITRTRHIVALHTACLLVLNSIYIIIIFMASCSFYISFTLYLFLKFCGIISNLPANCGPHAPRYFDTLAVVCLRPRKSCSRFKHPRSSIEWRHKLRYVGVSKPCAEPSSKCTRTFILLSKKIWTCVENFTVFGKRGKISIVIR